MAQRSPQQELVMEKFRRQTNTIVSVITDDEVKTIARILKDNGHLLKRELEKIQAQRTPTEAAETLVDYVTKKDIFDMTQTFLNEMKKTQKDLVNEIMNPNPGAPNEQSEKPTSASSGNEIVSSTARLEEDVHTTRGSADGDQDPPQPLTVALAQDEIDLPSYPMEASPHGECLIINNVNFSRGNQRNGSDKDVERLKSTFSKLGFAIHHRRDLDSAALLKCLRDYAAFDHSRRDSFVCFILSHGSEGNVLGCDSVPVSIRDLMQPFVARSCQSLIGKPKLFFIQACQGNEEQKGALPKPQTDEMQQDEDAIQAQEADDVALLDDREWASFLDEDPSEMETDDVQLKIVPDKADFLIGYSTVPGYISTRHAQDGTIYIRKLCEVLEKYSPWHDLLAMLTKVNAEVSEENMRVKKSLVKQTPEPRYTLRMKVFFKSQLPSTDAAAGN